MEESQVKIFTQSTWKIFCGKIQILEYFFPNETLKLEHWNFRTDTQKFENYQYWDSKTWIFFGFRLILNILSTNPMFFVTISRKWVTLLNGTQTK